MGVKVPIFAHQLPKPYRALPLHPTIEGCRASVYYLGEEYILKLFDPHEDSTTETALYPHLHRLPVPLPLAHFMLEEREALLFPKLSGTHPISPSFSQLRIIGAFLQQLHSLTIPPLPLPKRYSKSVLYAKIQRSQYPPLLDYYHTLEVPELREHKLIHGDLFRDNALFEEERLTGVIDWSDCAWGDPLFDVAVVALDWCFEEERLKSEKLSVLLHSYHPSLDKKSILPYISYALLYYATTRYLAQGNYQILLKKLERLHVSLLSGI